MDVSSGLAKGSAPEAESAVSLGGEALQKLPLHLWAPPLHDDLGRPAGHDSDDNRCPEHSEMMTRPP